MTSARKISPRSSASRPWLVPFVVVTVILALLLLYLARRHCKRRVAVPAIRL